MFVRTFCPVELDIWGGVVISGGLTVISGN